MKTIVDQLHSISEKKEETKKADLKNASSRYDDAVVRTEEKRKELISLKSEVIGKKSDLCNSLLGMKSTLMDVDRFRNEFDKINKEVSSKEEELKYCTGDEKNKETELDEAKNNHLLAAKKLVKMDFMKQEAAKQDRKLAEFKTNAEEDEILDLFAGNK